MRRAAFRRAVLVAGSGWAMIMAQSAAAQEQEAPPETTARPSTSQEDIIVTANRREERLVDVPGAVTALSGKDLTAQGLTQIEDYVAKVPGFSIQTEGRLGTRLVLRGQNTGGSGASVATMVDDVVLNTASGNTLGYTVTANFETYDLERIEVLRGPQGTLYGATAQGGLLKYVTTKPKLDRFEVKTEVGLENVRYGETGWSAKAAVNVPLIKDVLAIRVLGYYKDLPGYIDNPLLGTRDLNGGEQYGGRASLLFTPTDDLKVRLTVASQQQSYGAEGYTEVVGSPTGPNLEAANAFDIVTGQPISRKRFPERNTSSYTYYNGVIDYDFGPVALTSSTSYVQARSFYNNDITDLGLAFFGTTPLTQRNDHNKFNQEIRLASSGSDAIVWQVGGFYSFEDITYNQKIDSRDPTNFSQPGFFGVLADTQSPQTYRELSGFGDVTFRFGPRFHISLGGRYTYNEQTFRYTFVPALFSGFVGGTIVSDNTNETKFTFAVAPRYNLTDDISVYARVASGYRPGGPIPNFGGGITYSQTRFRADNTLNYEIGVKGTTPDNLLAFDVALYQIDWRDIQIVTGYVDAVTNVTFTAIGNGDTARSRGIEWAFTLRPIPALSIGASGALTDAQLTANAAALGGLRGDRLPYVPDVSNSVTIDYSTPFLGDTKLDLGGSWSFVGGRFGNFSRAGDSNHPAIPSYHTLDLRAGLSFSHFRVDAGVRNLTDTRGITSYTSQNGFNRQFGQANIIQPRTFTLRFSTAF